MRRHVAAVAALLLLVAGLTGCSKDNGPANAINAFLAGWTSGQLDGVGLQTPGGVALPGADVTKLIEGLSGDLVPAKAKLTLVGDPQTAHGAGTGQVKVEWTVADGLVWAYDTT